MNDEQHREKVEQFLDHTHTGGKSVDNPLSLEPKGGYTPLADYDPNLRWAKHTIEIDLQLWAYKLTVTTTIGGNLHGFAVLEHAISNYLYALVKEQGDNPTLHLVNAAGDTMECQPDDEDLDLWIESMCVGLRIVKHEAEERAVKAAIARATGA